jgi:hypothetical protein
MRLRRPHRPEGSAELVTISQQPRITLWSPPPRPHATNADPSRAPGDQSSISHRPHKPGTARLRAVEQAYRTAAEHDTAFTPPEPARALRSHELQAGGQIDLEAEP